MPADQEMDSAVCTRNMVCAVYSALERKGTVDILLSEMSLTGKDKYRRTPWNEVPAIVRFTETESRRVVSRN